MYGKSNNFKRKKQGVREKNLLIAVYRHVIKHGLDRTVLDSEWTQNGLGMDSEWTQNGLRMDSEWTQNGLFTVLV
jgi:hypothetical protein